MELNTEYSATKTMQKAGGQFLNIVTSTAFASLLSIFIKQMTDKNFEVTDIKNGIDQIAGSVVLITPFISAIGRMLTNIKKHYFKKK